MRSLAHGATVELALRHGSGERRVRGVVRHFDQHASRIAELEAELALLRVEDPSRWEIATDDGRTIGFLPEHVIAIED